MHGHEVLAAAAEAAESKKDAADKIHRGFHDIASYGEALSTKVGLTFDKNQNQREKKRKNAEKSR